MGTSEPIRTAFVFSGGASHWTGGLNYLRNALQALRLHAAGTVDPVLFLAPEVRADDAALLAAEASTVFARVDWLSAGRRDARFRDALLRGRDLVAEQAFRSAGIHVAFEAGEFFGTRFPIPALTWVADFQSHHLPQYFVWRARWRTYLGRRLQLLGRRVILLSSQDAERDCLKFYPRSSGRTLVVPFAVPQPADLVADASVVSRHGLPTRYLYLPNQFWQHKNHRVVIDALALAQRETADIVIAASGSPVDHRRPGHFTELQARVANTGLDARFRFLGLVPASDVPQLALQSVAVVNPSLFEGWSSSVEEAKSLGVPVVLSDIAVHREQAGDRALYFGPHSPQHCAEALIAAWQAPGLLPAQRLEAARISAAERSREFGRRLAAALSEAAALGRAKGGGTA